MATSFFSHLMERIQAYAFLMRIDRPVGTYLLLWPTVWALWVAGKGDPDALILIVFVFAVFLMRAAGCIINDWVDRKFDGQVERTKHRPLVTGLIKPRAALVLFTILCMMAFGLALLLNSLTICLSLLAVCFAISYPYMKRFLFIPQMYLGIAWYLAIPMVFAAQLNTIPAYSWLLYIAVIFWAVAYDTIYAMMDAHDDRKIGIKSAALLFGKFDREFIALAFLLFIIFLSWFGWAAQLTIWFFVSIFWSIILIIYQLWLIRHRTVKGCMQAFLSNQWIGVLIFIGLILNYWLEP